MDRRVLTPHGWPENRWSFVQLSPNHIWHPAEHGRRQGFLASLRQPPSCRAHTVAVEYRHWSMQRLHCCKIRASLRPSCRFEFLARRSPVRQACISKATIPPSQLERALAMHGFEVLLLREYLQDCTLGFTSDGYFAEAKTSLRSAHSPWCTKSL